MPAETADSGRVAAGDFHDAQYWHTAPPRAVASCSVTAPQKPAASKGLGDCALLNTTIAQLGTLREGKPGDVEHDAHVVESSMA